MGLAAIAVPWPRHDRDQNVRVASRLTRQGSIDPEVFDLYGKTPENLLEEIGELISDPDLCEGEINGREVTIALTERGKEQFLLWLFQTMTRVPA